MPCVDVCEEFFTNTTAMLEAHSQLTREFDFSLHMTSFKFVDKTIRRDGLLLSDIAAANGEQNLKNKAVNTKGFGGEILCLQPHGALKMRAYHHPPPYFVLAIAANAIPEKIGYDWSYSANCTKARGLRRQYPTCGSADIFVKTARQTGSFACYETIAASALHVCTRDVDVNSPSQWPLLTSVLNTDISLFNR